MENKEYITVARESMISLLKDQVVAFRPLLARSVGGVTNGLLLSQLLFWCDKGHNRAGWVYKTQKEFYKETALTRTELENARKKLRTLGVVEEKKAGMPRRVYFRINFDKLRDIVAAQIEKENLLEEEYLRKKQERYAFLNEDVDQLQLFS